MPIYGYRGIFSTIISPTGPLWFLISLVFWYVLLQLFIKLRHPILVAVTLGLLVGYGSQINDLLSLSRTIVFFPFFLVGYYFEKDTFKPFNRNKAFIITVAVIMLFVFGAIK